MLGPTVSTNAAKGTFGYWFGLFIARSTLGLRRPACSSVPGCRLPSEQSAERELLTAPNLQWAAIAFCHPQRELAQRARLAHCREHRHQ